MDAEVQIKGMAELEARLLELDALGGQKLIRRILRKVAKPMADSAKANAASVGRSGALYRSIGLVNRKPKGAQVARIALTSRAKERIALRMHNDFYGRKRKGIFYGWMLDQGTVKSRARPWWTPAVSANESQAVRAFVTELAKAVARMEKRSGKTPNPDALVPE